MKTILVFVSTLDGKITKWGNPDLRIWSSQGDKQYFNKLWKSTRLIVMGSKTYNVKPLRPSSKHHFIIMTHHPCDYKGIEKSGQLEFTDESPQMLFDRFGKEDHELMLVVGGAQVATSFLKQQLIDELWLTCEPKIFGSGGNFVSEEELDIDLELLTSERINEQGTLINKYKVIKSNITQ